MSVDVAALFFAGYMNIAACCKARAHKCFSTNLALVRLQDDTTPHLRFLFLLRNWAQPTRPSSFWRWNNRSNSVAAKVCSTRNRPKAPNGRLCPGEIEVIQNSAAETQVRAHENAHIRGRRTGKCLLQLSIWTRWKLCHRRTRKHRHISGRNGKKHSWKQRIRSAPLAPPILLPKIAQLRTSNANGANACRNCAEKAKKPKRRSKEMKRFRHSNGSEETSTENATAQKTYSSFQNTRQKKRKGRRCSITSLPTYINLSSFIYT